MGNYKCIAGKVWVSNSDTSRSQMEVKVHWSSGILKLPGVSITVFVYVPIDNNQIIWDSGFVDLWQAFGLPGIVEEQDHEGIQKIGEVNDMLGAVEESRGSPHTMGG